MSKIFESSIIISGPGLPSYEALPFTLSLEKGEIKSLMNRDNELGGKFSPKLGNAREGN